MPEKITIIVIVRPIRREGDLDPQGGVVSKIVGIARIRAHAPTGISPRLTQQKRVPSGFS